MTKSLGLYICCMAADIKTRHSEFESSFPDELKQYASAKGIMGGEFLLEKMNFIEKLVVRKIAHAKETVHDIDLDAVEKGLLRAEKAARAGGKDNIAKRDLLLRLRDHLNEMNPARSLDASKEEWLELRDLHLVTDRAHRAVGGLGLQQVLDTVVEVLELTEDDRELFERLREQLTGIQNGRVADKHGWLYTLVEQAATA